MKLLYRLVFRELFGPFAFGVMAFTSIMFAGQQLLKVTNLLWSGTIGLPMAVQLIMLSIPSIVVFTLPMSTLLGVLLGIGRLSGDSEVVALFAGGISFYRIALPVLALGVLISGGALTINETVVPWAHMRLQTMQAQISKDIAPNDRPFIVPDDGRGLTIMVKGGMDPDKGVLKNVSIIYFADKDKIVNGHRVAKNQPIFMMYSDTADWEGLKDPKKRYKWKLDQGWLMPLGTDSPGSMGFGRQDSREEDLGKTPSQFALYQKTTLRNSDQLSFRELSQIVNYLSKNPDRSWDEIRQFDVNRWNKLALPLSSLIFALLAAPMAIRPSRSSSSVGFGLSILLIVIYWVVWNFTSHLAIQGNLAPMAGAFAADALGIATAIALIRRVAK